jgi:hypothetical protein
MAGFVEFAEVIYGRHAIPTVKMAKGFLGR